jgi:hypothetical protein
MRVIKNLIFHDAINSYRKLFYKKIVISNVIFILSILYIIIILVKTSYLLKSVLSMNDIKTEMLLIYSLILIAFLDLIVKIMFSKVKISNVYPYLRLKIQRKKLANFIIIINHFNIINILELLLLIPITIICIENVESMNIEFICNIYF